MDTTDEQFIRRSVIAWPELPDDPGAVVVVGLDADPEEPTQPQRLREAGCIWELYFAGRGRLRDADGQHEIAPGTALVRLPGIDQAVDYDPAPRYAKAFVSLTPGCGRALEGLGLIDRRRPVWRCRDHEAAVLLHTRLQADCRRRQQAPRGPQLWARLVELFARWREEPGGRHDPLARAAHLLARDSLAELTPAAVAREVGLPYHRFRRAFKQRYGAAPLAWRLRARMQLACRMLPDHSVSEVATACGYRTPYAFSIQFRRSMGLSPSQWKAGLHAR